MKKVFIVLLISLLVLGTTACKEQSENVFFEGTILEVDGNNAIVEPFEDESIRGSADKISIDLSVSDETFEVGDNIKVEYTGEVMESYPAQVNAISIEKID